MIEHTLLLPQYAESLIPDHIEAFQAGMVEVRSIMDMMAAWARRIMPVVKDIIRTIAEVLRPLLPFLPRIRISKQTRRYLLVRRHISGRARRYEKARVRL